MIKIYTTCIVGAMAWCSVAQADTFFNAEINGVYPEGKYAVGTLELQYGYKDGDNKKSWYISGGPIATDTPFTDELEYTFGGFLGGAYRIDNKTAVYGEVFGDTNETVVAKTGFTYTF